MIDDALALTVDVIFPPKKGKEVVEEDKNESFNNIVIASESVKGIG
jgi:hypothetical protein